MKMIPLLLVVFLLSACGSASPADQAQMADNVAVAERYFHEVSVRQGTYTTAAGDVFPGVRFDASLTGADLKNYLGLNLRAWCAWGVRSGALTIAEARGVLAANGLPTELPTDK